MRIAVVGASGYVGQVTCQLALGHPRLDLVAVQGQDAAGEPLSAILPGAGADRSGLVVETLGSDLHGAETVILGLPHGLSQELAPDLLGRGVQVIDLGADFRFKDPGEYEFWYGTPHKAVDLLQESVYGLVEVRRAELVGARLIGVPGCYVTAASLGLWPLVARSCIGDELVIVDGYSGVSGAGKGLKASTHFVSVNENLSTYGLLDHRHTGEMEMNLGRRVLFTPHLAPITRGILATSYAVPMEGSKPLMGEGLLELYREIYADSPFVRVVDRPPGTREVLGTNFIAIHPVYDPRTNRYVVISVIDNLVKGAAGQAIQALNVSQGWPEELGLDQLGVWP
ncbi:N-acetyl-gamma-glutamyl-phosphate reductase [Ferrimicrobium sp.]|uniref:N-acetyl-gamma-glutamyl-phosphate reductase n=1 Tax=Ferrimicrobium sp. TaxID=2926050 RepID=UPI00261B023F|nr:N-acetyl-gamma-glutamyl-phosphate reductase [Ferrimicrobium sp.]